MNNKLTGRRARPTVVAVSAAAALTLISLSCCGEKNIGPGHRIDSDAYFKSADAPYALLWMESSAEYEAICLQTYNIALASVRRSVEEVPPGEKDKPVAVVMDLDETVIDNLAYMAWLRRTGRGVNWDHWDTWECEHIGDMRLVPGALDFIRSAESMGVTVLYISNREEATRSCTVKAMVSLGIVDSPARVEGEMAHRLQLFSDTSDKDSRRAAIVGRYRIVAWLGDNLGDFPGGFAGASSAERKARAREAGAKFGVEYFLFPNPSYGRWLDHVDQNDPESDLPDTKRCEKCLGK